MQEILRLVFFYLSGIWRFRWYALLIAASAAPLGWVYVATLPDQYASSARVFVDTDSVLNDLLRGLAIQTDENRRIAMMTRVLFSNENMEKLARMTDLDLRAKTPQAMEELVSSLKKRVSLAGERGNIYSISFADPSPDLARRVVQSMLTIFVESNLGTTRRDQDSAEQFLQREIKEFERRMVEVDRKLKDFKMRNLDFVTEKGDYYQRLRGAKDGLVAAQEQLNLAIKTRDGLRLQVEEVEKEGEIQGQYQYEQWIEESAKVVTSRYDARINEMRSQLDDLLLKYTDRHPDVIALRDTIERLQRQAEVEETEFKEMQAKDVASDAGLASGLSGNPLYQQMRLRLAEAQINVTTQEARVDGLGAQIAELQAAVDKILYLEAEEQQLNQQSASLKSNHAQMIARLEKARLTRQVDTSVDTVRFRTLDPPSIPREPAGPDRVLLSSIAFGLAVAAGIGVALLLSLLRPVFNDRRQLTETTGIPVLGSVNMIWSAEERNRRRTVNMAFSVGFLGLLISFGLVLTAFYLGINPMSGFSA